ncbi:hypothetical protein E4T44_01529 [Aureobasidium sp. EXF-8845]|nr:hypothetical protein E4T44_01529 [Aureobasidium sp. EXF-8845]
MSSRLEGVVTGKLRDALAFKTAKHHAIKPEPELLLAVSENGSNLKVELNMPDVGLRVLEVTQVGGQILTVTDGLVSLRARLTIQAKDQFRKQSSSPLSTLKTKSVTATVSGITHTHLGPRPDRLQLLLSSLAISSASYHNGSNIKPIHQVDQIKAFMDQLQQLHQPATTPLLRESTAVPATVPAADDSDFEMTEPPPNRVNVVEGTTPLKRPHSPSSPTRSSSHRSVRPRTYNDDADVIIQTGLNLNQPVQLQSNTSHYKEGLLKALLNKGPGARISTSTDHEQALRLGMSAHMAPPPKPATKINDLQAQLPSQADSQPLSQVFESQIPLMEVPVSEVVAGGAYPEGVVGTQSESLDIMLPKITMPSNTPTSAQPEPLEVTQSSLPRVSSQRIPLPSQAEALAASMGTSSSHLLDETSSGDSRPLHRAPSALFIKYARRPIPTNQQKLLDKSSSWWPSPPGKTFPRPNIPVEDLNKIEKAAVQRAAKTKKTEQANRLEKGHDLLNMFPATQGTQNSELPWSSSPEHHTEPRCRNDTLRRSTNVVEPDLLEIVPPDKVALVRLLPGDLPPDSSADLMQVDEPEKDDPVEEIPSSPPDSAAQASPDSDIESHISPVRNLRQLPEFSMSSPEETSSRPDPGAQLINPELQSSLLKSTSRAKEDDPASSPILEVAASPQPHESIMDLAAHDELSILRDVNSSNNVLLTNDQNRVDDDDDEVAIDDQLQVMPDRVDNKQRQVSVTQSSRPGSRKDRPSGYGLVDSPETETILERGARLKREFFEQQKKASLHKNLQATAQLDDEIKKNSELPVAKPEPQPDPMEIDESPVASTKSFDPDAASKVHIIEQWRRQSDQSADRQVAVLNTEDVGSAVDEPPVPLSVVAAPPASEVLTLNDARTVRPSLPRSSYRAVTHAHDANSKTKREIKRGVFGEPTRALWIGSLPDSIRDDELKQIFAEFDPLSAFAKIKSGFVNFSDVDAACRAFVEKHNSLFKEQRIVCKFTAPRGPAPIRNPLSDAASATWSLTIDGLFDDMVHRRNFKGNKTAFTTLCKNLHTSSDIPLSQWDNYVVLQPAEFLPWANRTIANGGRILDYDTYWRETLEQTAKPDRSPILTPAKLNAIFNKASGIKAPATIFSAPVSPQTSSGTRRPLPSALPVHRTPLPARPLPPRSTADDMRRSVVEHNAQSTTSTPQNVTTTQPHPLLNQPDPVRTSKWIRQNFKKDPHGKVLQQELYQKYKEDFMGTTVPLLMGNLFLKHVFNTYPGTTISETDDEGNKKFYCTGLRHKFPPRPMSTSASTKDSAPEFKIKGVSASSSAKKRNRDETLHEFRSSPGDRGERSSRRSLPFREERQLSRSRSPPRPPLRAPKGKPASPDHLLTPEVSIFSLLGWFSYGCPVMHS